MESATKSRKDKLIIWEGNSGPNKGPSSNGDMGCKSERGSA